MNRSTWFRLWRRLAEASGLSLEKRHPHVAKHTLGTVLARQNVNAYTIRQALGHKSISSSAVYTAISDRDASAAAKSAWMAAFCPRNATLCEPGYLRLCRNLVVFGPAEQAKRTDTGIMVRRLRRKLPAPCQPSSTAARVLDVGSLGKASGEPGRRGGSPGTSLTHRLAW